MAKKTKNVPENKPTTTSPVVEKTEVVADLPKKELVILDMTDPAVAAAEKAKAIEEARKVQVEVAPTTAPAKPRVQSTVGSPVKLVWQIATEMKAKDANVRRKDVVEACVKAGVALHTARTQYQRWFKKNQAAK